MKKLAFGIFMLVVVGLFTDTLFAKFYAQPPECAASCNWMQSCYAGRNYDIYNCEGNYTAVVSDNCRWDVTMKDGKFYVDGHQCGR